MKENLQGSGGAANEVGVVNVVVLKHAQLYDLVVEFTKQAVQQCESPPGAVSTHKEKRVGFGFWV
jgi:hypothetical protein